MSLLEILNMFRQRIANTYLLALILLIFTATGSSAHDHEESEHTGSEGGAIKLSEQGKASIGLLIEKIEVRPVLKRIQTTGKLEAIPTLEYIQHAPLAGRVAQVLVRLGDHVSAGETLVSVSSPDLQELGAQIVSENTQIEAEINTRRAELDGDVSQAQTQKDLADANFGREYRLYQEKIASKKAMQQAKAELDLTANKLTVARQKRQVTLAALKTKLNVNLKTLKQRLKQFGLSDNDVERMLASKTSMTSVPVRTARAGLVTELAVTPGQSIDPSVPLAKVSDLNKLWATANIYESDMSRVRLGESIVVKVSAYPNDTFSGKLSFISSSVDPVARVLPVKVEVTNKQNKLRPGMFTELAIETAEQTFGITLPKDAVISDKGHYLVYVEKDGVYMPTPVEIGNSYGDKIEIRSGLVTGQPVVIRGAFQLDAQRLKSIGDTSLFSHPTEEGHDEHEEGGSQTNAMVNPQFVIIIVIAFVFGCAVTALLLQKRTRKVFDEAAPHEAELHEKGT